MDETADAGVRTSDALARLTAGNARFLGAIESAPDPAAVRSSLTVARPYAIVLGCSDSRVAPEIVFDETLGRLFVIRVASNVAGPEETGTVEYALARWDCPLLVVLGHTQCGGIAAAMGITPAGERIPDWSESMNLGSLLSSIRNNLGWMGGSTTAAAWDEAVRRNVRETVAKLTTWSVPIRRRVQSGELDVRGAVYDVETGRVEFL